MSAPCSLVRGWAVLAALVLALGTARGADAPQVLQLRVQQVGDETFFHVKLAPPKDCRLPTFLGDFPPATPGTRWQLSRLPKLLPQDDKSTAVAPALGLPHFQQPLQFAGKLTGKGDAKFLLVYPTEDRQVPADKESKLDRLLRERTWAEVPLTLDFSKAETVPASKLPSKVAAIVPPDELGRVWAQAEAQRFAVLEASAPDFGFYGFAREAINRKYFVAVKSLKPPAPPAPDNLFRLLYGNMSGPDAVVESLQAERLLRPERRDKGARDVDVSRVACPDAPEYSWEKLLAGKKPEVEPLAKLVPHDNYYVHFKSLLKLIEAGDLLSEYGASGVRAVDLTVRDERLQQRYERQMCVRSGPEARLLGGVLVKGVAMTGSDLQLREGSDVTTIFHVGNPKLFLASAEPWLDAARKEFGDKLKAGKDEYLGVTVESYVSPLREISLHRTTFDDFVIYSNSPVAIRRVIDTAKGKAKSLAESPDFQYLRMVFPHTAAEEDGFVFTSDAFLRRLASPAVKIKQKRRLEALTSLHLATNAALFSAWETGKLPADDKTLLAASGLKAEDLDVPDGKAVTWDAERKLAVSEVYGTLQFSTPLLELPIDKVTADEERDYGRFRREQSLSWGRYTSPAGMRVSLQEKVIRAEALIQPLAPDSAYADLRFLTGGGTVRLDPADRTPNTLVQGVAHVGPEVQQRRDKVVGDWIMFRLESGPVLRRFAEAWVNDAAGATSLDQWLLLVSSLGDGSLPLLAGFKIDALKEPEKIIEYFLPGATTEQVKEAYRNVDLFLTKVRELLIVARLHHARAGDAWYISFNEAMLKAQLDLVKDRQKQPPPKDEPEANASLYLTPEGLVKARDALGLFL